MIELSVRTRKTIACRGLFCARNFATGIATGRAETGRYQAIQIAMPTADKANKIRPSATKRDGQRYQKEIYKIDQSTGRLDEPNRYPAGNGANWVEIVEVQ